MATGSEFPADVTAAIQLIQRLQSKSYIARSEKDAMNRAKLTIAFWACRNENVVASRDNLAYVLGEDAAEIMGAYDKYLEREDDAAREKREREEKKFRERRRKAHGDFWQNAKD